MIDVFVYYLHCNITIQFAVARQRCMWDVPFLLEPGDTLIKQFTRTEQTITPYVVRYLSYVYVHIQDITQHNIQDVFKYYRVMYVKYILHLAYMCVGTTLYPTGIRKGTLLKVYKCTRNRQGTTLRYNATCNMFN